MSTFGSFEIGRRALHTQQKGSEVTGQNIANANTEGYTRQTVHKQALRPPAAPGVETPPGYGVEVSSIDRVRSEFYDDQIQASLNAKNYWEKKNETYSAVESILQEPGDLGINDAMADFFDAWDELSVNPESMATRSSLKEQAESLTTLVKDTYNKLVNLQEDVDKELKVKADEVNSMLEDIAEMNDSIEYLDVLGQKSNELLDERDLRIEELSEMLNFDVEEVERGVNNISVTVVNEDEDTKEIKLVEEGELKHGIKIVEDNGDLLLKAQEVDEENGNGEIVGEIVQDSSDGALQGLLESHNEDIPEYMESLDKLVFNLVKEVNQQHLKGVNLEEKYNVKFFEDNVDINENFVYDDYQEYEDDIDVSIAEYDALDFEDDNNIPGAEDFKLNEGIQEDVSKIAAALPTKENEEIPPTPGDGENALRIAQLRDADVIEDTTYQEFFRSEIADLGVKGRESQRMFESAQNVTDNLVERRNSISSVSIDDEMLDMLQYQHAYNAAARFMSTFDEMLTVLMNEL